MLYKGFGEQPPLPQRRHDWHNATTVLHALAQGASPRRPYLNVLTRPDGVLSKLTSLSLPRAPHHSDRENPTLLQSQLASATI
jgi:hypothetical protein